MRSLTTRFFAALVLVAAVALALGTWWVRHTVERELARVVIVEEAIERVGAEEVVRETRQERGMPAPAPQAIDAAALTRRLLIALAAIVVGSAVATALVARRVLAPVRALRIAVDRMARGDATARVALDGRDELGALGRAFNAMADALADQERSKRDLTRDIAHELRTPLTDLRCHLEALQDRVVDSTPERLAVLQDGVQRLQRLVEDLDELARAEARQLALEPHAVDVPALLARVAAQVHARASAAGIAVMVDAPADVRVWTDGDRLQQVLGNLVDNALSHTPAGGSIHIGARAADGRVHIAVRDTGPGIPAAHLPHVFDRLYRVDPSRSRSTGGAGLGLAIARQLVEAGGGCLTAESPATGGATFTITLPAFTNPS